jgi:uncharacterized circularly permuted ATP-grasp superfamily protein
MYWVKTSKGIWIHITGTDLIRGDDGEFMVLEDNLRCPSGVSYMLENRELLKRTFPEVLGKTRVQPISDYPTRLLQMLQYISDRPNPTIVCLRQVFITLRISSTHIWHNKWVWS